MCKNRKMWVLSASVVIMSVFCLCFGGWTEDGGYIGAYPGGCSVTGECPPYELCMHIIEETICPKDHQNLCRCTLGCELNNYVLRYEQYRPIPGKGFCMCKSPKRNETECTTHLDL